MKSNSVIGTRLEIQTEHLTRVKTGRRLYTRQESCQCHMSDAVFVMLLSNSNNEQCRPHMPISWSTPDLPPARFVRCHGIPLSRLTQTHRLYTQHKISGARSVAWIRKMFDNTFPSMLLEQTHLAMSNSIRQKTSDLMITSVTNRKVNC